MTNNDNELWGITGLTFPYAIRSSDGEVLSHGAMKVDFNLGLSPEKLPEMAARIEKSVDNILDVYLFNDGPEPAGKTISRISIGEYVALEWAAAKEEAEDDDEDDDEGE